MHCFTLYNIVEIDFVNNIILVDTLCILLYVQVQQNIKLL